MLWFLVAGLFVLAVFLVLVIAFGIKEACLMAYYTVKSTILYAIEWLLTIVTLAFSRLYCVAAILVAGLVYYVFYVLRVSFSGYNLDLKPLTYILFAATAIIFVYDLVRGLQDGYVNKMVRRKIMCHLDKVLSFNRKIYANYPRFWHK